MLMYLHELIWIVPRKIPNNILASLSEIHNFIIKVSTSQQHCFMYNTLNHTSKTIFELLGNSKNEMTCIYKSDGFTTG